MDGRGLLFGEGDVVVHAGGAHGVADRLDGERARPVGAGALRVSAEILLDLDLPAMGDAQFAGQPAFHERGGRAFEFDAALLEEGHDAIDVASPVLFVHAGGDEPARGANAQAVVIEHGGRYEFAGEMFGGVSVGEIETFGFA